jgi:CubicO group peptidase (beta-lactamase class C family)
VSAALPNERTWHSRALALVASVIMLVTAEPTIAQPAADTGTPARAHRVDALFATFATGATPGAAVVVARGDTIVFARGYGLADVEHGVSITPATSFRLASVTKQFTAAAILTLVEAGKLGLDDRVSDLLPGLPAYAREVRVRHLLSHTSGIADYEPILGYEDGPQIKDRDVLMLLRRAPRLYFAPGTSWRYSNSGYALLALIVEQKSGETFAHYLRHRIFDRAGMPTAVAHEDGVDTVADRAYGYTSRAGVWHRTDQSSTSAVLGDGGIYASAEELAHWSAALDRNAVLTAESFAMATTPATLTSGERTAYGFGWFVDSYLGRARQRHEGDSIGFRTAIQRYPAERLTIVVLVNRGAAPIDALSDAVTRIFLEQ